MAVSERWLWKTGWVRYSSSRSSAAGRLSAFSATSTASTPNAAQTPARSSRVVVSSVETEIRSSPSWKTLMPLARAAAAIPAARPGTTAVTVSKNSPCSSSTPPARRPSASAAA